jgi:hypothetical protein
MNYFVLMMLMGVKSDDTICDLWHGIISKGGCLQIKDWGSHHVQSKKLKFPQVETKEQ